MKRLIFDICIFLSVFLLPWWVVLVLALIGIYMYEQFYEGVVSMILIQILYVVPSGRFIASDIYFPIVVIIIFYILNIIKKFVFIKQHDF